MINNIVSINGEICNSDLAKIPINNVEFSYGYGVYESLKVRDNTLYFPEKHSKRLLKSAELIGIVPLFQQKDLLKYIINFKKSITERSYNIKILLIGAPNPKDCKLYIFASNPLFISKKQKNGVKVITYAGSRPIPNAKTLNMLTSYLAYSKSKKESAYDALLIDNNEIIHEGTRTNLFYTDGKNIFTPPRKYILNGITRETIIESLKNKGIEVIERELKLNELQKFSGYALASTSINILPINQINDFNFKIPKIVKKMISIYKEYLTAYKKNLKK